MLHVFMASSKNENNTRRPAPDLLPGASADIRAAVAVQLARVNPRKLTAGKCHMSDISENMGRPLCDLSLAFAAEIVAQRRGVSLEHAKELLAACPEAAGSMPWRISAIAIQDGIKTATQFRAWLNGELLEAAE